MIKLTKKDFRAKRVCITGVSEHPRRKLYTWLRRHHAFPVERVTKATDIIVVGQAKRPYEKTTDKQEEAKRRSAEGAPLTWVVGRDARVRTADRWRS